LLEVDWEGWRQRRDTAVVAVAVAAAAGVAVAVAAAAVALAWAAAAAVVAVVGAARGEVAFRACGASVGTAEVPALES